MWILLTAFGCTPDAPPSQNETDSANALFVDEPCQTPEGIPGHQTCSEVGCQPCRPVVDGIASDADWLATELLGRPRDTGVTLHLVPAVELEAFVEATAPDGTLTRTSLQPGVAGEPLVFEVEGLRADTAYAYRVVYRTTAGFAARRAAAFHTQRAPGSTFTFTIQADSHLDDRSSVDLYHQTLDHALASNPDFHIDLGDTFMCEKHSAPLTGEVAPASSQEVVMTRYLGERAHFDRLAHSAPLFLVNGNHEGETGFLLDGTPNNIAVWATLARKRYYPNPEPGGVYTSSATPEPLVGARQQPYAWRWGDALFVVLDPFWATTTKARPQDRWSWTLGDDQYRWLHDTLMQSDAAYTFVFAHHLVGGNDSASRGGVEQAPYFEWGGLESDGTDTFAEHRPGWEMPIHDLFVAAGVTAFFHGHDHVYVRQELDGVTYQEVPQPSAENYRNGATLAAEGGYTSGTILGSSGHLRVTVGPDQAVVAYVRSYLPEDQSPDRVDGAIEDTYTLTPRRRARTGSPP